MEGAVPIVVQPLPGLGLQIPVGALESELLYPRLQFILGYMRPLIWIESHCLRTLEFLIPPYLQPG